MQMGAGWRRLLVIGGWHTTPFVRKWISRGYSTLTAQGQVWSISLTFLLLGQSNQIRHDTVVTWGLREW